jgi:hypothetical protein
MDRTEKTRPKILLLLPIYSYRYRLREGFIKYAVEMGSVVMIYISSLIKIGLGIQKFIRGGSAYTHRQHGDLISLLLFFIFFKIREVG